MAYAPPSGVSVYDVIHAVASIIPHRIIVPSRAIAESMNTLITSFFSWIIKPVVDGIRAVVEWLIEQLGFILNGAFQAIVNAVYLFIINPIKSLIESALNRIYDRLEGVIFIAITVPAMIIEAKSLVHKPSFMGFLMLALKPIMGYIVAKLTANVIKPSLKPVVIEPSIPPTVTLIPPLKELNISHYDSIAIEDEIISEFIPPVGFTDTLRVEDYLMLEALPPLSFLDYAFTQDYINIEVIPPFALSDSISIEDSIDVEIIPPLSLSDEVMVEDILIIGVE